MIRLKQNKAPFTHAQCPQCGYLLGRELFQQAKADHQCLIAKRVNLSEFEAVSMPPVPDQSDLAELPTSDNCPICDAGLKPIKSQAEDVAGGPKRVAGLSDAIELGSLHDVEELQKIAAFLYGILDDIDTLDDACREHDDIFRNRARLLQSRTNDCGLVSDGQTILFSKSAKRL